MTIEDGNVALFLMPGPAGSNTFMAAPAESDELKGDLEVVDPLLPEKWEGKFKAHLYPIESFVDDVSASPNFGFKENALDLYKEEGISHVALLEGPIVPEGSEPFYFNGEKVTGISVLVLWCTDKNKYRLVHCYSCGITFAQWLTEQQEKWENAHGQGAAGQNRTLN